MTAGNHQESARLIMTDNVTRTTCPYCGVGCGVLAQVDAGGGVTVKGDPEHPANFGRLCSKGAALADTLDHDGRLLYPEIRGERCTWEEALDAVADGFTRIAREHGPDAVAFYVSGQLLTEDYYVANKLMKGYLGSANIDTNSRLCMASAVSGYKRAFGADSVPCSYDDLALAQLIVLVGSNTAWCHPVLFQRMTQAKKDNPNLRVVVIDPRRTATCDIADLHLAPRSGFDSVLFNGLLVYLEGHGHGHSQFMQHCTEGLDAALAAAQRSAPSIEQVAQHCGLTEEQVRTFYQDFAGTERTVTVFSQGINQSISGTDKVNSIINCHLLTGRIGRAGMGPFSFTGQPNAMGGREVGGLANQLAAHMDIENPGHRELVQTFWQSPRMAQQPGLKAVDLFKAVGEGRIKALWIMGTNPAVSLPDVDRVRAALAQCELVVLSDCMRAVDSAAYAHVLLPAAAWGEKDGTVTNSERRMSRQRAFLPPPGEARPDWWIITQVARRMGHAQGFAYESVADIFREHARLSGTGNDGARDFDISALAQLADDAYADLEPVQWPVNARHPAGTPRMFTDGRFFTPSGRARFIPITPVAPAHGVDQEYPLVLNTGRVRDQWHTMTRTGKAARLCAHQPEPYIDLHARDAARACIADGSLVRVASRWGEIIVRAHVSEQQRPGEVFVPMHWSDQYASKARVGAVVNPAVDPVSGEPEFKHTPVRIEAYQPAWHGFLLSRRRLGLTGAVYWALAKGDKLWRYEIAGDQPPDDWAAQARSLLCNQDNEVGWIEYFDKSRHQYRGARLVGERLESCIFIGPGHVLPPRDWLAGLFSLNALDGQQRTSLLTGAPGKGRPDAGRTVCACFNVGVNTIVAAIRKDGLSSPEAIGAALQAGTNCGSCVPELRALIAQADNAVA
jgi:assimilatory nitrate reductase catalytic subunit